MIPPTYATGRHPWWVLLLATAYCVLMPVVLRGAIDGTFPGSPLIRTILHQELLGILSILLVGLCLRAELPSFEVPLTGRVRRSYFVAATLTCLLPVVAVFCTGVGLRTHLLPQWEDAVDSPEFGLYDVLPRAMTPAMTNAIVLGACALILLSLGGLLTSVVGLSILYPILLWATVQPWGEYAPYSGYGPALDPTPRPLWALFFVIVAGLVWARRGGVRTLFPEVAFLARSN